MLKLQTKPSGSLHSTLLCFEWVSKQITYFTCPRIDPKETMDIIHDFLSVYFWDCIVTYHCNCYKRECTPELLSSNLVLGINSQLNILLWNCHSEQQWGTASIYKLFRQIPKQGKSWWAVYAWFFFLEWPIFPSVPPIASGGSSGALCSIPDWYEPRARQTGYIFDKVC